MPLVHAEHEILIFLYFERHNAQNPDPRHSEDVLANLARIIREGEEI